MTGRIRICLITLVHSVSYRQWNQIEKKHCGKFPHIQISGNKRTNTCRALEIARRKKAEGDIASALKFAKKSQALFSNPQTEGFLATLADAPTSNGTAYTSGTSTPSTPNGEGPTSRKPKPSEHKQGRQDTQYTKEQMTVVERVRKCK